jgi:ParB-like chromosome segregation protein Spo0J
MQEAVSIIQSIKDLNQDATDEPDHLRPSQIHEIQSVFQIRGDIPDHTHVSALLDVLKRGGSLKPVTVWRCGEGAILIDGHHRLHAYKQRQKQLKQPLLVPVEWFSGSLDEALEQAAAANNEVKLPLSSQQRKNFGWRLVILNRHSKAEIAKMAGIAERTVANMRAAKKTLLAMDPDEDLPLSWTVAFMRAKGADKEGNQLDYEDFIDQQAQDWANRLSKTFSTRLAKSPVITAKTLAIHLGDSAGDVARLLMEEVGEEGALEEEEDDLPF